MMYNKIVQECFFSPVHVGIIALDAPLSVHCRSPETGKGVLIDFYLQCTADKIVHKACFKAIGNPYVIASLEWLCRQIEGKNLDQLPPINYQMLVNELEIINTQYPVAIQVESVYKEALVLMRNKFEEYES